MPKMLFIGLFHFKVAVKLLLVWINMQLLPQPLAYEFEKGDLMTGYCGHWTYAFSERHLFHLWTNEQGQAAPELQELSPFELERMYFYQPCCIVKSKMPRTKRTGREDVPQIGETGFRLAQRMHGVALYTHMLTCHCKHYVDYVVYGTTFGRWYDPTYLPMDEKCPLHRRVRADTDVNALDFWLEDASGNRIELPRPQLPQLAPERPRRASFRGPYSSSSSSRSQSP